MTTFIWYWGRRGSGPLHTAQLTKIAALYQKPIVSYVNNSETHSILPACEFTHNCVDFNIENGLFRNILKLRAQFYQTLVKFKPDKIVVPMAFAALPFLIDIPKRLNIPLTYILHDIIAHKGDPTGYIHAIPQKWIVHFSQEILCPSAFTLSAFQKLYPHKKSKLLPLLSLYTTDARPKPSPTTDVRFLLLGRLQHYKGLDCLAHSLAEMPKNGWQLTIAGHPQDEQHIRSLFQPSPQVQLVLKWLTHSEIDSLYQSHDILLAPYVAASQSGPVAQAVSTGMPCIVSCVGALPDQIGNGSAGWIHEHSTDSFATTMRMAVDEISTYARKSQSCVDLCTSEALRAKPIFDELFG